MCLGHLLISAVFSSIYYFLHLILHDTTRQSKINPPRVWDNQFLTTIHYKKRLHQSHYLLGWLFFCTLGIFPNVVHPFLLLHSLYYFGPFSFCFVTKLDFVTSCSIHALLVRSFALPPEPGLCRFFYARSSCIVYFHNTINVLCAEPDGNDSLVRWRISDKSVRVWGEHRVPSKTSTYHDVA